MIEPELAFADLNDDMACATAYLQYVVCPCHIHQPWLNYFSYFMCFMLLFMSSSMNFMMKVRYILENCKEDMDFFNTWIEKGIVDRLRV